MLSKFSAGLAQSTTLQSPRKKRSKRNAVAVGSVVGSTDWGFLCSEYKKKCTGKCLLKKNRATLQNTEDTAWNDDNLWVIEGFMTTARRLRTSLRSWEALSPCWTLSRERHCGINASLQSLRERKTNKKRGRILFKKKSGEHHTCLENDSISMIRAQTTKQSQYKKNSKMWVRGVWSGGAEDRQVVWSPVFRLGIWLDHSETDGPEEFKTRG